MSNTAIEYWTLYGIILGIFGTFPSDFQFYWLAAQNQLVNTMAWSQMTLEAALFLRKVASWGLPGVHDLPREIPLPFVNTELQTQLSELIENGVWDRDG